MRPLLFLATVALPAIALAAQALPWHAGPAPSRTREFSMDEKWHSVGKRIDGIAVIRRELRRAGNDLPASALLMEDGEEYTVEELAEIPGAGKFHPGPSPRGFRRANNLQMKTEKGFIDISCGTIPRNSPSLETAFAESGWHFVGPSALPGKIRVATLVDGRETSFAILDEKKGECLLIRQLEK